MNLLGSISKLYLKIEFIVSLRIFDYKQKGFTSFIGRIANAWDARATLNSPVFSHSFEAGLNFRMVFTYPPPYPPYFKSFLFDYYYAQ